MVCSPAVDCRLITCQGLQFAGSAGRRQILAAENYPPEEGQLPARGRVGRITTR